MVGTTKRNLAYRITFFMGELHSKYPKADSDDKLDAFDLYLQKKFDVGNIFMTNDSIQKSLIGEEYLKSTTVHPENFSVLFKGLDKPLKNELSDSLNRKNLRGFTLSSLSDKDVEQIIQKVYQKWQD